MFMTVLKSIFGGGNKTKVDAPKGGRGSESVMFKPKNSMMDDIKMDLGIMPKNDVYYRDLAERSRRSQEANAKMMASMAKNDKPSTTQSAPTPAPQTPTSPAPQPPQPPQPPSGGSTPGDAEQEVIDQVNDQQNASSGSSQAGGTIATTAAGLLSGDDAALRRRRRLQGSGLIS